MEGNVGAEGKFGLALVNGKLVITGGYDGKGADANISISLDGVYFCDELAKLVPGDTVVEQFIIGALKAALMASKI